MSNQVYLNPTEKIFNWNGINAYFPKDGANVVVPVASPDPNYQHIVMSSFTANSVQVSGLVSIDPDSATGPITFLQSGMYNVQVTLAIRGPASTASVGAVFSDLTFIRTDAFNDYIVDKCINFIPISASQVTITAQLRYCGYIQEGTSLIITVGCGSVAYPVDVLGTSSTLLVNRLY